MQIRNFRVKRYRSINAATLDLRDLTVLLGPNNEGKSNILRAMVLGMTALEGFARAGVGSKYRMSRYISGPIDYDWDRDFPLKSQATSKQITALEFDFLLDSDEISDFEEAVGSKINGELKIRLSFSRDGTVSIRIIKQKAGSLWTKKAAEIAAFIGSRVGVEYVPSIRTSDEAERVVARLVAEELMLLEREQRYQKALEVIKELQKPKLDEIGESIRETLSHFLPDVRSVEVQISESRRYAGLSRSLEIIVDDGQATGLGRKGDGVQSLAAIALLRRAAMDRRRHKTFVLAVEEPEAHLHPFAIREIRSVLALIAADQQVVVTTHSPLLADPLHVERNVIVESSKAKAARTIGEVRASLGVRLEDNLQSARLALIVEGDHDVASLRSLLATNRRFLREQLDRGSLAIESLGGGGKLKYRLSQYATGVCASFVLLDNDKQGRASVEAALADNLLQEPNYALTVFPGKSESELEDFVDPDIYLEDLNRAFGLTLTKSSLVRGRQKWSNRLKEVLEANGKLWNLSAENRAKRIVAHAVTEKADRALLPQGIESVNVLSLRLESLLGNSEGDDVRGE